MKGVVIKSTGSWYKVLCGKQRFDCRIKGRIRLDDAKSTNPIAVGDWVECEQENETQAVIASIYERTNYIIRKAANLSKQSHIIAANVDMAYLVVTVHSPRTLLSFIDRFLLSAEAYSIPCTLLINKCDLCTSDTDRKIIQNWIEIYRKAGYEILCVSAHTSENIETLYRLMAGKTVVFAGNSGVGKSSLLNAIAPEAASRVAGISKSHNKGKHTTTFAEMYELPNGARIIDTPGVKSFGLLDFEKGELSHYFPEIFNVSKQCQFHNCTHTHEPQCAVQRAVQQNEIAPSRYENYVSCLIDENTKHRK
ncbi:MAG: ribosome small subunit-dependent GTPase A [Bacteroidales bacterium]|jgi:ribosome biogenesis GTPase|nr:ribosome small subunit-dependent GTPase A [Bacteroidales bacterium]